jgi:hypothetical protein
MKRVAASNRAARRGPERAGHPRAFHAAGEKPHRHDIVVEEQSA